MATTKGKNFERFPVLLGSYTRKIKKGTRTTTVTQKYFASVTTDAIEALDLTIEDDPYSKDGGVEVRGTKGAGSIKVSLGKKTTNGNLKYHSIPVPNWFKIKDMRDFVKSKIPTANRFTAPSGRTYGVKRGNSSNNSNN